MANPIEIVGYGARTAVGDSVASAAAVRAGVPTLVNHPFFVDRAGDMMPAALVKDIDPRNMGTDRLLALAEPALFDACAGLSGRGLRVPLFIGLPEQRPGFTSTAVDGVRAGLGKIAGLPVAISEVNVFPNGHAAGLIALRAAIERMNRGLEACIVGGVDSYFEPDTMEWLDEQRQLMGSMSRSGFIPGEGAGFLALATAQALERNKAKSLGRILSTAQGVEKLLIKTADMCLGEGLAATVLDAIGPALSSGQRINEVYCDINGERYRGEEWGFVCLRASSYFDDPTAYHSPATSWGDVGAASGPLFAMLACRAAGGGYATGPRALLWASSERGQRAAAVFGSTGFA